MALHAEKSEKDGSLTGKSRLLQQLQSDRQREDRSYSRRGRWLIGVILLAPALAGAAMFFVQRPQRLEIETASAAAPSAQVAHRCGHNCGHGFARDEVDVNESSINRVKPDQSAEATLDANRDWTIPAHVIAIIPAVGRSRATAKARSAIDRKDSRLLPDMGVKVSLPEEAPEKNESADSAGASGSSIKRVLIPASALAERSGKSVVLTVDGDRAHAQETTSRQISGDLLLIEGIANGTIVLRTPPAGMNDSGCIVVKKRQSIRQPSSMSSEA